MCHSVPAGSGAVKPSERTRRNHEGRPRSGPPAFVLDRSLYWPPRKPHGAALTAMGSWLARSSRGSGKNIVSVTVATVSTSIV